MAQYNPGTLDPLFGSEGIAPIPDLLPIRSSETLQVRPATLDSDGSFVCGGYASVDGLFTDFRFTRLFSDGRWDEATGHVLPPMPGATIELVNNFEAIVPIHQGGRDGYLAVSRPVYQRPKENIYHLAVAKLDRNFQPWGNFGDNGFAVLPPPEAETDAVSDIKPFEVKPNAEPLATDYRGAAKAGFANGLIRVIFQGIRETAQSLTYTTYLALLDPDTGELPPTKGLRALPRINESNVIPYRVEFHDDGSFLVLGLAGDEIILMRCTAEGELDARLDGRGYKAFPVRGNNFGMATDRKGRIWLSSSGNFSLHPTIVYCFNENGSPCAEFNGGNALVLLWKDPDNPMLRLDHLKLDSQGRVILAGTRQDKEAEGPFIAFRLEVVRLLPDGSRDMKFGDEGFAIQDPSLSAANDLYVSEDGIRVLSLTTQFYEVVAKFQS